MKRRKFVQGAATAGVAAAASTLAAPAISQGLKEWKLAMSWPLNSPGLGTSGQRVAQRITQLSGGKISVKVYGGGELVPAFGVFDAVSAGDADMYHSAEYYWQGKHKGFNFFTAVPYGLTGIEHAAWMKYGGGQELWDELAAGFNLKGFQGSSTGTQMGGWYRQPIQKLDDFKGLKFRMPGIGGRGAGRRSASRSSTCRWRRSTRRSHRAPSTPPNGSAPGTTSPSASTRSPSITTIRASTSRAPPPAS